MARKYSNIESPAVGEVFIAPWGKNVLIVAQPHSDCIGCVGDVDDLCRLLPLCGSMLRDDGVSVSFVLAEEE